MPKPHIYRKGDEVVIVEPKWVKRVGYPIVWTDLIAELRAEERTMAAWLALGFGSIHPDDLPIDFIRGIARQHVERRRHGGNERTIHYWPLSQDKNESLLLLSDAEVFPAHGYVGRRTTVLSKRVVKTGTRVPGGGYGEDWTDGYLNDEKTHILLRTYLGEIEAVHVRPAGSTP